MTTSVANQIMLALTDPELSPRLRRYAARSLREILQLIEDADEADLAIIRKQVLDSAQSRQCPAMYAGVDYETLMMHSIIERTEELESRGLL